MKPLRVLISGLGRIAWQYHLPTLWNDNRFQVLAVADPVAERRREAEEAYPGLRTYAEFEAMLDAEEADLLVLASPTLFHCGQAMAAMKKGLDIFCEKPLSDSLGSARQMLSAARNSGRKLMVYQPHRFTPAAELLRGILRDNKLGTVFLVRRVCTSFNRRTDWQSRLDCGGGMLNNYGAHFIDQFLALFGPGPLTLNHSTMRRVVGAGDAEDMVLLELTAPSGVTGQIEINMGSAFPEDSWHVFGTRGSARYSAASKEWQLRYLNDGELPPIHLQSGLAAAGRQYNQEYGLPWHDESIAVPRNRPEAYYDKVYAHFAGDAPPAVPPQETLELMRLIHECRKI